MNCVFYDSDKTPQENFGSVMHCAKIEKNKVVLDGFEIKGKKRFQLKYPTDIDDPGEAEYCIGELTLVLDVVIPQIG